MKRKNKREHDEPNLAHVNIGELFVTRRLHLGYSVKHVAEAIKLGVDVVERLESNQFDEIGGAVYVRGYLSLYARYVDLDAAYVMGLYNEQCPQENTAIRPSLGRGVGKHQSKRHSKTLSFVVACAVFVSLVTAYAHFEPQFFPQESAVPKTTKDMPAVAEVSDESGVDKAIREADNAQTLADDVLNNQVLPSTPTVLPEDVTQGPIELQSGEGISSDDGQETSVAVGDGLVMPSEVATDSSVDTPVEPKPVVDPNKYHLVMEFNDKCWLKIKDANNKTLASGIYSKSKNVDVTGKPPFKVSIGRPESIASLQMNDSPINIADYKVRKRKYIIK